MVSAEKQIFHCFGCQAGGNAFGFLMRYENITFPEALRQLAERAHIRLPEPDGGGERQDQNVAEKLYEIYQLAAGFYHAKLAHPETGRAARDYFTKRGFPLELAKEFQLGWAPDGWRNLLEFLSKKGFPNALLFKSGLIYQSSQQGQPYDVFRQRLLFPIRNLQGKVVAFGGRIIGESEGPKYLNSPENPIFQKRRELFGLYTAKKHIDRQLPRILVVEGYLDFLRLYEKGFKNVVATLGTALTHEHVRVLKRFAEEAVMIYDGDPAGESASLRGLEIFLEEGMNVKIVRMPEGYDPDDFLKKESPAAFAKLLAEARDFFDYQMEILLGRYNRRDSLGLMKITGECLETFTRIQNTILLDHYLKRLAHTLGVDENSLRSELAKLRKKTGGGRHRTEGPVTAGEVPNFAASTSETEILFLALLIEDEQVRARAFREVRPEDFDHPQIRELYRQLTAMDQSGDKIALSTILNHIENDQLRGKLTAMSTLEWSSENKQTAVADCRQWFLTRRLDKELNNLRFSISKAERSGDTGLVQTLMTEYQNLLRKSAELKESRKKPNFPAV